MKLIKAQMQKRPTYETLLKDTILEPKDKIALPGRAATILRKTKQLTRYDDAEFLDLEKDNEKTAKEKAQQLTVGAAAAAGTTSIAQEQALQPGPHQGHTFVNPTVVPQAKRTRTSRPPRGLPQTHINPSPLGPAQSYAPAGQTASTAASSSSAPAASTSESAAPQHLGSGVHEAVDEAKVETDKVFAEAARQAAIKKESIRRQIAVNLGPSSETADASYVARLAADASKSRGQPSTGYGPAATREKQSLQEKMDATHLGAMGPFFRNTASAQRQRSTSVKAASVKAASPPPQLIDVSKPPIPTKPPPYDPFPAETREAAMRRITGKTPRGTTRPSSESAPKSKARSRSTRQEREARSPAPPPKLDAPPPNEIQIDAAKRRDASKVKQTPKTPSLKPTKAPSPKPTKAPSPAKSAAAASSAYPTFDKTAAKVSAKTPKVVNASSASSAPQGPPPSGKHVAGPKAADMGPNALLSTDPAFWVKQTKGVLHDQLAQRGYINKLSAKRFGKLTKEELTKLILSLPPPTKKP